MVGWRPHIWGWCPPVWEILHPPLESMWNVTFKSKLFLEIKHSHGEIFDTFIICRFGSWTYDGSALNLQLQADSADTSSYVPHSDWTLIGVPARRNVVSYDCCPEEYIDITFTIKLKNSGSSFPRAELSIILSLISLLGRLLWSKAYWHTLPKVNAKFICLSPPQIEKLPFSHRTSDMLFNSLPTSPPLENEKLPFSVRTSGLLLHSLPAI